MARKIILSGLLLISAIFISCNYGSTASEGGIKFESLTVEQAKKLSKETGKPIFIDCYTDWCGYCKRMSKGVFRDPEVGKAFNEKFINLKVEMEKNVDGKGLARKYRVNSYPTLIIINAEGELLSKKIGAQDAASLKRMAASIN